MKHYYKQVISKFRQITSNFFGCLAKKNKKKKKPQQYLMVFNLKIQCGKKITIVKQ